MSGAAFTIRSTPSTTPRAAPRSGTCSCNRCRRRRELEAIIEDVPTPGSDKHYSKMHRSLRDASVARRFGGYEEELQHEGKFQISPVDYINWVKRSLNRLYGAKLVSDPAGSTPAQYRTLIKRFQSEKGLKADGQVGKATQNALIKANESSRGYMTWVHRALESAGVFADIPRTQPTSSGSYKSEGMRLGIYALQKRPKSGLEQDGFVGVKTEGRLIQACKCRPPGHFESARPGIPRLPAPPTSWNEKRRQERENARPLFEERAREAISVLSHRPPTEPVKRTICILKKLLLRSTDSRYVTNQLAAAYANRAAHGAPPPWSKTENLLDGALDATRLTSSTNAFIDRMINLDYEVLVGLSEVNKQYQLLGYATPDMTARRMRDWISTLQGKSSSVYSCYK